MVYNNMLRRNLQ